MSVYSEPDLSPTFSCSHDVMEPTPDGKYSTLVSSPSTDLLHINGDAATTAAASEVGVTHSQLTHNDHVNTLSSGPGLSRKSSEKSASTSPVMPHKKSAAKVSPILTCKVIRRHEKFHKHFQSVPIDEHPIDHFSCAYQDNILIQGIMYVCQNWVCFYSKIKARGHKLEIPMGKVCNITREKTARIIPNAIGIHTPEGKFVFGSFMTRDSTYRFLLQVWKVWKESYDSDSNNKDLTKFVNGTDAFSENNNNIIPSVEGSQGPSVESSESESSGGQNFRLADVSDSDGHLALAASEPKRSKSSEQHKDGLLVTVILTCFPFHKIYRGFCYLSVKITRAARSELLLALCTVMVMLLFLSAIALTYKVMLLQARLEARQGWSPAHTLQHRDKMYHDVYNLHSQVHSATIQRLHSVLQTNIQVLSELGDSLKTLQTSSKPSSYTTASSSSASSSSPLHHYQTDTNSASCPKSDAGCS